MFLIKFCFINIADCGRQTSKYNLLFSILYFSVLTFADFNLFSFILLTYKLVLKHICPYLKQTSKKERKFQKSFRRTSVWWFQSIIIFYIIFYWKTLRQFISIDEVIYLLYLLDMCRLRICWNVKNLVKELFSFNP